MSVFVLRRLVSLFWLGWVRILFYFSRHPSFFLSLWRSVCVSGALCIWVRASVLVSVFCFCFSSGVLSPWVCSVLFGICRSCSMGVFSLGMAVLFADFSVFSSCVSFWICLGKWCSAWVFDFLFFSYPRHEGGYFISCEYPSRWW